MRGAGGDLVICEEFAHMDKSVWKRVVVPTLITGAAMIGITTRGYDQFNFVTQLLKLKTSSGDPLFRHINIDLCCDHCKRIGREDSCRHKMGEMPYWHDASMYKHIKEMFGDDEEAFLVETKGMEVESGINPAFDKAYLDKIFEKKNYVKEINYQKNVYIGIDPAAGGDRSKYAMVSAVYREAEKDLVVKKIFFYSFFFFGTKNNGFI